MAPIATARRAGTQLELGWSTGETKTLPLIWVRDNCVCSECRIEATGEHRYFLGRSESLPQADSVTTTNGTVSITWCDGHVSDFCNDDFAGLVYIANRSHVSAQLWADDFDPVRFSRSDILNDLATRNEFLAISMRDGMTVVTDMPNESGECIRFLVAHTAEALPPHNDFASYMWPPSGQLIHMLINEVDGGEWVNVDGFKVLAKLWQTNPEAVQVLSRVPVAFREHADYAESWTRAPIVRIDGSGNIIGIRFSNQLMQPMSPFDPHVEAFYEAYHLLSKAVSDPVNQIAFRGHAGTMQFVHGHRILHSRRAFDSNTDRELDGNGRR